MNKFRPFLLSIVLLVALAPVSYAGNLTIRLVEATNNGKGDSGDVADIADVLRKNLQYKSFALVDSGSVKLPSSGSTTELGPFVLTLSGSEASLAISVTRDGKNALTTTVTLGKRTPLVLGGFSSGAGKLVLVFTAN